MIQRNPSSRYRSSVLKAIIFDWAGTTIDYGSCAPVAAFVDVFQREGIELSWQEAREPMGMAKRDHIAAILAQPKINQQWQQKYGQPPGESDIDRVYALFLPTQKKTLKRYSKLIPGTVETVAVCRERGLKIGSSTGYTHALMEVVMEQARSQGYEPDAMLCADDDLPAGRPAPWMALENAKRLGAYPLSAVIKVDDTTVGIEAGRNAGMWTIGIVKSGNLVGLPLEEVEAMDQSELQAKISAGTEKLFQAGAHFVVDTIAEIPTVLDEISL